MTVNISIGDHGDVTLSHSHQVTACDCSECHTTLAGLGCRTAICMPTCSRNGLALSDWISSSVRLVLESVLT